MHVAPPPLGLFAATLSAAILALLAASVARAGPGTDGWGAWPKVDSNVTAAVLAVCPTKQSCDVKDPATGHPYADDTLQLVVSGSGLQNAHGLGKVRGDFDGSLSAAF